jgi:hypothetical protein
VLAQVPHDGLEVHVAAAERAVHALPDRFGVGAPPVLDLTRHPGVDVLHVGVRDPLRGLPGQLGRVGAADQQVPGVQAERDLRAVQHPLHLVRVLHHGSDVRVQHGAHLVLGGQRGQPVQVGQQGVPAGLVQGGALVVAVQPGDRGQHQGVRAGRGVRLQQGRHLGQRVVVGAVQQQRGEAPDRVQVMLVQRLGHRVRGRGEEALRPELGGGQAHVAHLGQHAARVQLVSPAGDLAHAPGDRSSRDPIGHAVHLRLVHGS